MIKITVGNSYSNILGLTATQQKRLSEELSYLIGGSSAYYTGFGPKRRSLLGKRGDFPTGLLQRLNEYLDKQRLPRSIDYGPRPPFKGTMRDYTKSAYAWQVLALAAAYKAPRGSIRAPTGSGKSRCMGMFAESFDLPTLWVVPSLEIKKQTIENYGHLKKVTITNIDDPRLASMSGFDVLIIDECHGVAAKRYHKLNKSVWKSIYYRYSFSATTFRNDDEETLLYESIAGREIYSLSYSEAVKDNYIVPIEAYYIESPKKSTNAFSYREVYDELVVHNSDKNDMIAVLLRRLTSLKLPTICMVREVAHGEILSQLTGLPFVSGADDESRKYIKEFNSGNIAGIIGTTGVLGEGVDTKPCEYVIIAGSGKAKSQFMQACGRALRIFLGKTSAKIIIVKDRSHKFLTRHYNAQRAILKEEYGVLPAKLEVYG